LALPSFVMHLFVPDGMLSRPVEAFLRKCTTLPLNDVASR
jgi:hypothetical protein